MTITAPAHEDMLADAWLYALGVTDNARRKLTDADVEAQPNHRSGVPMWEQIPLTRLANWYVREFYRTTDHAFIRDLRKDQAKAKGFTAAQVRGAVNVMLGEFKRGWRADWMVAA